MKIEEDKRYYLPLKELSLLFKNNERSRHSINSVYETVRREQVALSEKPYIIRYFADLYI